jgi:adenylate cyclase
MVERERKFLVPNPPGNLSDYPHDLIRQGYLAIESTNRLAEVRLRRVGERYVLTVKQGRSPSRLEVEVALPPPDGRKLWRLTRGWRVRKVRYRIPHEGLTIELDVYLGKAKGLCVAEVEFESDEALQRFEPPPWFGQEVTGRRKFANRRIAVRGWKQQGRR